MKALSRPAAFAILLVLWAAIYLPGLGSMEIKGEEIRRIMPGVNMLETGDWIVPHFNGVPYLRKPPLVNWAIALSIKSFGVRNEWTARIPSVLAMLAMGCMILGVCSPWLGTNTALAAVLIAWTSIGIIDKGRLAEIEAIYIALFGMAVACWFAWTAANRSRWLIWSVVGLLLGLGLLAKGPPLLAFFYPIVAFVAWRRKREGLANWSQLGVLAVMALISLLIASDVFLLWGNPYLRATAHLGAAGIWTRQMEQRLGGGSGSTVFANFRNSLINFAPWILALPLFWRRSTLARLSPVDRSIVEGARWPIVFCAFALMFIPGMLPRYTLPLIVPWAILLALLLKAEWNDSSLRWPLVAGCAAAFGMLIFGILIAPRVMAKHSANRDFGKKVDALKPPGAPLYVYNAGVQPEIFYIRGPLIFPDGSKVLPENVQWLLIPEKAMKPIQTKFQECHVIAQFREESGKRYALISLQGHKGRAGKLK